MNEETKEQLIENMVHNLPTLRAKANLTQAKLAEMIGVSRQSLVSIENKKRKMMWNTFLTCFLIFYKNPESKPLLTLFGIYTDELNSFFTNNLD